MLPYTRRALLIIPIIFSVQSAQTAEINKTALPNGKGDVIAILGQLQFGDEKTFVDAALGSPNAIVLFQSPGGNLIAGIEIGKAIHLKGFTTLVPAGTQCASACALAWLGGQTRLMSKSAKIGFHAVYTDNNGQPIVSSSGNALVGAYLNQIGLPYSAVVYITSTAPEEMQWLTLLDARRFGIAVEPFDVADSSSDTSLGQNAQSKSAPQSTDAAEKVRRETVSFFAATNLSNAAALNALPDDYSDRVDYFGKNVSRDEVMRDKAANFQRWPNRTYSLREETLTVDCISPVSCKAEGVIAWNVMGHGTQSKGSATYAIGWNKENGAWKIVSELSKVIERKLSRLQTANYPSTITPGEEPGVPKYELDASSTNVLAVSNLYSDNACAPLPPQRGTVVKRNFDTDGIAITGFVLEEPDGTREFINVSLALDNANMVTRGWVTRGVQTLLAVGRNAVVAAKACGASGRVLQLDAAR